MQKYTISLATSAGETYGGIRKLAKESGPQSPSCTVLELVDRLIDTVIPNEPLDQSQLGSPLSNTHWVSEGTVRIYFVICQPDVIVVTRISTTPRPISSRQKADAMMREMVASGQLKRSILETGLRLSRSASVH